MQYKFRVWDPITKSYSGGNLWHIASDGTLYYGNTEWPEGIVEMCTGLCDKNGVEVYEGDIYHHRDKTIKYVVEWHDTGLMGKQMGASSWAGLIYFKDETEVIGNIHEGVKE